jgi:hypothetical protein
MQISWAKAPTPTTQIPRGGLEIGFGISLDIGVWDVEFFLKGSHFFIER